MVSINTANILPLSTCTFYAICSTGSRPLMNL